MIRTVTCWVVLPLNEKWSRSVLSSMLSHCQEAVVPVTSETGVARATVSLSRSALWTSSGSP